METRFEKLMTYYEKCSGFDDKESTARRVETFFEVFGDLRSLEQEFHGFMGTLKSDVDRIRDAVR